MGGESSLAEEEIDRSIQLKILTELQRVNARLDSVEDEVAAGTSGLSNASSRSTKNIKDNSQLCTKPKQTCVKSVNYVKTTVVDSSSDELDVPEIKFLRASKSVQQQADQRLAQLDQCPRYCKSQIEVKTWWKY